MYPTNFCYLNLQPCVKLQGSNVESDKHLKHYYGEKKPKQTKKSTNPSAVKHFMQKECTALKGAMSSQPDLF